MHAQSFPVSIAKIDVRTKDLATYCHTKSLAVGWPASQHHPVRPDPGTILLLYLPIFLLIVAGFGLRRTGVLTAQADESLLGIVINLLLPCLALDVILGNEALTRPANLLIPPVAGFATVGLGIGAALCAARIFLKGAAVQRTFGLTTGIQNYGYIPIPLCMALFDRETVGVLLAFNLGVEVAFWTIGLATVSGGLGGKHWARQIWTPPMIAICLALGLNSLGADAFVPEPLRVALHMLGQCAVPFALLLTGAMLADHARPGLLASGLRTTGLALVIRLLLLPVIIITTAVTVPMDPALSRILVVQGAMPSAAFSIVMARVYGGDMPTAMRCVFATSLAALATIPLWLSFGLMLLNR